MTRLYRSLPASVWRVMQVALVVALFALLWHAADGPAAAQRLANADWSWFWLAVAALTVQTILSALRWRLTAGQFGLSFSTGHAIKEYYLSQIMNQSLPGGVIGDAGRAYRSRGQAGLIASGQAVVFERLAGQIAMFLALAVAFLATSLSPGGFDWPAWLLLPVGLFVLAGIAAPVVLVAATRLPGALGRAATRLWRVIRLALIDPRVLPAQVVLSIGTTLCNLAAFAFCAQAIGVDLSPVAVAALVPLILFTMLIPISFSGWGLREGAAAALLPIAGVTASGGLATSVAFGLAFMAAVLPGAMFLQLGPRTAQRVNR